MEQRRWATDWIGAYMEWMTGDDALIQAPARFASGDTDGGEFFTTVYLEWMDAPPAATEPAPEFRADDAFAAEREQFRETVLLDALHMEAECVHIVRQTLDQGSRSRETLALALETLRNANKLLEDEARAWQTLSAGRQRRLALAPTMNRENHVEYNWSHALEEVAVDVQSLTGRVLALRTLSA